MAFRGQARHINQPDAYENQWLPHKMDGNYMKGDSNRFMIYNQNYRQNRGLNQSYESSCERTPDRNHYNGSHQNALSGSSSVRSSPGCFACGEIGHVARRCPNAHRTAPQYQQQDMIHINDRYKYNNNYYKSNFDSSNQSASRQICDNRPIMSRESTNLLDVDYSVELYPTIRGKKLKSILDTGSTRTIINSGVWNAIRNDQTLAERRDVIVETVNSQNLLIKGSFKEMVE